MTTCPELLVLSLSNGSKGWLQVYFTADLSIIQYEILNE